jgi:hypothetical protein
MRPKTGRSVFIILAATLIGAPLLHHAAYKVASYLGIICGPGERDGGSAVANFTTDQLCWPSGFTLDAGKHYRITLDTDGDWFDHVMRADITGVASNSVQHLIATPLKRWWFENWFQPIARIGEKGNDEYVLRPNGHIAAHDYHENPKNPPLSELKKTNHFTKIKVTEAEQLMEAYRVPDDRKTLHSDITARTSGQLYLYLNDAVLMWPGRINMFYRNNFGNARVSVELIKDD